jgi:hypothetical protein
MEELRFEAHEVVEVIGQEWALANVGEDVGILGSCGADDLDQRHQC